MPISRTRPLRYEQLERRTLLAISGPEQEMIYLINLARHDPVAYATSHNLGIDLGYVTPQPPLAVNDQLHASAEFHATEMATHNYAGHQSEVTGDWPNKMARDAGYPLPTHFANDNNFIESLAAGFHFARDWTSARVPLDSLIIDEGVPSLGHRNHLLGIGDFNAQNREIGVGYAFSAASDYRNYWTIHATRRQNPGTYLTGVVYNDLDGDQRYDAGEGLSGVTVTVGAANVSTNAAGGWSVAVPNGSVQTVTASGGTFGGVASGVINVGADNIEVDFLSGRASPLINFAMAAGSAADWHNVDEPFDLQGDGDVDLDDAVAGIRFLRRGYPADLTLVPDRQNTPAPFMDSDGNGRASPDDVVLLIRYLRRRAAGSGEAELNPGPAALEPTIAVASLTGAEEAADVATSTFWVYAIEPFTRRRR